MNSGQTSFPSYGINSAQIDDAKKFLKTTAGSEAPVYIMFHTNEDLLSLIAQSLSDDNKLTAQLPLTPAS